MAADSKNSFEKSGILSDMKRYFSSEGILDESSFGRVISNHIDLIKEKYRSVEEFQQKANIWLSDYISGVISYLKEKGMTEAAFKIFKAAIEKSSALGVPNINIPSNLLNDLLSKVQFFSSPKDEEDKKLTKDDKRDKIFKAALQVFSDVGFYKATMDKIATMSGVGKGSVYRYFKSKEELLEQLLEDKYSQIVANVGAIFSNSKNVLEGIKEMIEYWISFIDENPVVYKLIQSADITTKNLGGKTKFYRYMSEHLPRLKEKVVELNKNNKLKSTGFYTVFYGIFGFIDGVVHKWFSCNMDYPLTDEIPIVLETIFNGFVGETNGEHKFYIPPQGD